MRAEARVFGAQAAPRRAAAAMMAAAAHASPAGSLTDASRLDQARVLRAAWKRYRFAYGDEVGFFPDLFAAVLEREWAALRFRREHGAEQDRRDREAAARRAREPRVFMGARVPPALAPAPRNTISST